MNLDQRRDGVDRLAHFARRLSADGVADYDAYKRWREAVANRAFVNDVLALPKLPGISQGTALVGVDFHPRMPLMLFNYSSAAHNTLHGPLHAAWTPALRTARGTVFDHDGRLVALPFEKFFNYGKSPDTMVIPKGPWTATRKEDGHLAINFEYGGGLWATTRGRMGSPSSLLANRLVGVYEGNNDWRRRYPRNLTVLCELVGPDTRVHIDYPGLNRYVLIGAYDRDTLRDLSPSELDALGAELRIEVAKRWEGDDVAALIAHMQDLSVRGEEGFVIRAGPERIKVKFASYINLMVEAKLSYPYLMARIRDGKLDEMIGNLDEEVRDRANQMVGALMRVLFVRGKPKVRREYLYGLLPEDQRGSAYYRGLCGKFLRFVDAGWNPPVDGEPTDNDSD